jgi:hypothetical protein
MTSAEFGQIVAGLALAPCVMLRCPDQYVGEAQHTNYGLTYQDHTTGDFTCRQNLEPGSCIANDRRLIIVLESPHIAEFRFQHSLQQFVCRGPANGATGRNIRAFLTAPTSRFASAGLVRQTGTVSLILVNAVAYQCSLGREMGGKANACARKTRDAVFRACWGFARQDFCARLSTYMTPETLVLNACTRGETKGGLGGQWLRDLVEEAIVACGIPSSMHARACHPASLPRWKRGETWS